MQKNRINVKIPLIRAKDEGNMRSATGGVAHVADIIREDLGARDTGLHKPHITGIADLAACALATRCVNTAEWNVALPRKKCDAKSRERYISRLLANKLIKSLSVMHGFIPEIIDMLAQNGQTIILSMDQSKISDGFECLMISIRTAQRAMPVIWKVVETEGEIGFDIQNQLLESALTLIPEGTNVCLAADRFYGTSALINWCKTQGWQYRIRLKGNLIFQHEGGEITPQDAHQLRLDSLENACFNKTDISTNIGTLHEPNHPEPWFIAMDCKPSKYKVLDYGMRWGIECMFSDFKSRGFGISQTHLKHADRLERLILILTIAFFWAVSTGMNPKISQRHTKKNLPGR